MAAEQAQGTAPRTGLCAAARSRVLARTESPPGGIYESDGAQVSTTPFDRDELVTPRAVLPAVRMLLDSARNKLDHHPCGADGKFVADDHYRDLRQNVIGALEALQQYVGARYDH